MFTHFICITYIALMHRLGGAQWQMQSVGERAVLMCSAVQDTVRHSLGFLGFTGV